MATKIIIQRHAQSFGNRDKIYIGQTDLGLTPEGYMQAEIAAEYLKDEHIDAIYSSDLSRAYDTALPHAKMRGLTVEKRRDMREIFVGDWEKQDVNELKKLEVFTVNRFYADFVYPGGEANLDCAIRIKNELEKIANENPDRTVLVVTHGAAIRNFWHYIKGAKTKVVTDDAPLVTNTAFAYLTYENGEFKIGEYNVADFVPETKVRPV